MKNDQKIMDELRGAAAGLMVMSESDYPFEVIQWDGSIPLTPEYLRSVSGRQVDSGIVETDVEHFLGENEQFRKLQSVLENNLKEIKIYKVGVINIPVYIVGRSPEGNWLGVSTRLIQT